MCGPGWKVLTYHTRAHAHIRTHSLGHTKAGNTISRETGREGKPGASGNCAKTKKGVHVQKTQVCYPEREHETVSGTGTA